MCLGSIADKLQQRLYHTVGEFESDVQLVFTQSAASNQVRDALIKTLQKTHRIGRFHHFDLLVQRGFDERLNYTLKCYGLLCSFAGEC